jgi:putative glutamine amidotransferase
MWEDQGGTAQVRPIVGITSYVEPASWRVWHDVPATLLPHAYVEMVTAAGGRPVVLPPDEDPDVLRVLDALVLAGGPDLGAELYGERDEPGADTRPDRDRGEAALASAALGRDLPILGVCRGMELLAVLYGGRLHRHLPDRVGHDKHSPAPGVYGSHGLTVAPGSLAAFILSDGEVNSCHHQGVADPGRLTPTGWGDDGLIEIVEDPAKRFVLGVQWHPEEAGDIRLFQALVRAARIE